MGGPNYLIDPNDQQFPYQSTNLFAKTSDDISMNWKKG